MSSAVLLKRSFFEHLKCYKFLRVNYRETHSKLKILGIETSCDDTGCAIVTDRKEILGEYLISQSDVVLRHGGILPLIARDLHQANLPSVVEHTLSKAELTINDVNAIAVTVKPGLAMSLLVGLEFAKHICKNYGKPLIPIHHMEAHALTVRMFNNELQFPFLSFLISGGHCLLAIAHFVNEFSLLGSSIDDAPGEAFDKLARRLKVHNNPKYRNHSGGAIVELLAKQGNPFAFEFTIPLQQYRNCNFSFSGLKTQATRYIEKEESKYDMDADGILPSANDLCASFQWSVTKHLCWRLQRAMEYIELNNLLPQNNLSLVISGGAACNKYFRKAFGIVCDEMGYTLSAPPQHYCTDNGTMIAWNGVEKCVQNIDVYAPNEIENIKVEPKCPLGNDLNKSIEKSDIKCKWLKIAKKLHTVDD